MSILSDIPLAAQLRWRRVSVEQSTSRVCRSSRPIRSQCCERTQTMRSIRRHTPSAVNSKPRLTTTPLQRVSSSTSGAETARLRNAGAFPELLPRNGICGRPGLAYRFRLRRREQRLRRSEGSGAPCQSRIGQPGNGRYDGSAETSTAGPALPNRSRSRPLPHHKPCHRMRGAANGFSD